MKLTRIIVLSALFGLSSCTKFFSNEDAPNPYAGIPESTLYQTGESAMQIKDYKAAIKNFEALDTQYPMGPHEEAVLLNLIEAYHMEGDNVQSAALAKRFMHLYPRSSRIDYAYYMKAVAEANQDHGFFARHFPIDPALRDPGTAREGYDDFVIFVKTFPNSQYISDARAQMAELRSMFARKELFAAHFYFERSGFIAASNRANNVIKLYPETAETEEAYFILTKSNQKLGLTKEANESLERFKERYPSSKYLSQL